MKDIEKIDPSLGSAELSNLLRQKRLEKNISFEQLSEQMKLVPEKIEDLENRADAIDLSPFERGHLRNYATILDVDISSHLMSAKQIEKTYSKLRTIQQKNLNLQAPRNTRWLVTLIVLFVLLLVVYLFVDLFS
ncbi:helix-turn-helix domain-containing protein [Thiomicrospira microaerophila]|uniref:helix-turn-helix domain-containing protein n=1 Tax=Thiomicrospira microaerophila TaxID=406020 RepID=UPI0005C8E257|nr:helix-turn-helix domain-containing protein [Thiomicrospira microaerophila]